MNRILLLPCILILPCLIALGQTNSPQSPAPFVHGLALDLPAKLEQDAPGISLSSTTHSFMGLSLLRHSDNPLEVQIEQEEAGAAEKSLGPHLEKSVEAAPASSRVSETPHAAFSSAPDSLPFPHPDWKWRELPVRPEDVSKPPAPPRDTQPAPFQSNREMDTDRMALVDRLRGAGLLEPPHPIYDSELERAVGEAFRPEIIHIGHARFSCSIITAIARKNPFCLLDPSFFGISF